MAESKLSFEDFYVGREFKLPQATISAMEITAFSTEFDPQPIHMDEAVGKASFFGGLSASGWHTSSVFMRMFVDGFIGMSLSQGAPGMDFVEWLKPVLAGDTISGKTIVLETRPLQSRKDIGIVKFSHEIVNQRGQVVLHSEGSVMFRMKGASA